MSPEEPGAASPASTGSIPPSWARPAEDVSADVVASSRVPVALVLLLLVGLAVAGVVISKRRAGVSPVVPLVTATTATTTTTLPAVVPPLPPLSRAAEPLIDRGIAPEDDDAVAPVAVVAVVDAGSDLGSAPIDDASRKRARVLLRAARFAAKAGDYDKANALAQDAVDKDPRCAECWSTVAFLRRKVGDLEGFRAARLQARALAP